MFRAAARAALILLLALCSFEMREKIVTRRMKIKRRRTRIMINCHEKNFSLFWEPLGSLESRLLVEVAVLALRGMQVQVTLEKTRPTEQGLGWRHSHWQEDSDQDWP